MDENKLVLADVQMVPMADFKDQEVIRHFIDTLDVCEQSKNTYLNGLKQYFDFLKRTNRAGTDKLDVIAFKTELVESKKTPATISSYIASVRQFYKYLESEKIMPNVAVNVKGGKKSQNLRKDTLDVDQTRKVLSTMKKDTLEQKRNFAIVNLLIRCGIRTIEVVRADVGDIQPRTYYDDNNIQHKVWVLCLQGKGREEKDQECVLTDAARVPILDYLRARGPTKNTDPLFASHSHRNDGERLTTRTIRSIGKGAMVDAEIIDELNTHRLTTHSYRHGAISMVANTLGIESGRMIGRHSNIAVTMCYWHQNDRLKNAPEHKIDELLDKG